MTARRVAGEAHAPGLWSEDHIAAWKRVTDAIHARDCKIFCQILDRGRANDPELLAAAGFEVLSSSAVPIRPGAHVPRAMTEEDIAQTIRDHVATAKNAIAAGFDGVEVHGANGYLLDQFLQDTCNRRADRWGGSADNRARLHVEVARAVAEAVGADKVGVRLSPYSDFQGMLMDDPEPTFRCLLEGLKPLGLAYLHLIEARIRGNDDAECGGARTVRWMVDLWDGASPVIVAGGFTPETARRAADGDTYGPGKDVAVAFGRHFVSNPDLVYRVREGVALEGYDRSTFYVPMAPEGYADYPFSRQFLEAGSK